MKTQPNLMLTPEAMTPNICEPSARPLLGLPLISSRVQELSIGLRETLAAVCSVSSLRDVERSATLLTMHGEQSRG